MFAFGTKAGLEELAVTIRLAAGVSRSLTVNGITALLVFSVIVWLATAEIVGAWFTALTVSRKFVLVKPKLVSLTEMLTVDVPNWFGSGVSVTVRLAPLPPNTMLVAGNNNGLEEAAATVNRLAGVSASPIVKAIGPAEVFSLTVWLAMAEIVGGVLAAGLTCTTKLRLNVLLTDWPSFTVTVIVALPVAPLASLKDSVAVEPGVVYWTLGV